MKESRKAATVLVAIARAVGADAARVVVSRTDPKPCVVDVSWAMARLGFRCVQTVRESDGALVFSGRARRG